MFESWQCLQDCRSFFRLFQGDAVAARTTRAHRRFSTCPPCSHTHARTHVHAHSLCRVTGRYCVRARSLTAAAPDPLLLTDDEVGSNRALHGLPSLTHLVKYMYSRLYTPGHSKRPDPGATRRRYDRYVEPHNAENFILVQMSKAFKDHGGAVTGSHFQNYKLIVWSYDISYLSC